MAKFNEVVLQKVLADNKDITNQVLNGNIKAMNQLIGKYMAIDHNGFPTEVSKHLRAHFGIEQKEKPAKVYVIKDEVYQAAYQQSGEFYKNEKGESCMTPDVTLTVAITFNPFTGDIDKYESYLLEKFRSTVKLINNQLVES